jgi:hypothetical protein
MYCDANGFNINDTMVKKAHTAFAKKIRAVIDNLSKEPQKEEA